MTKVRDPKENLVFPGSKVTEAELAKMVAMRGVGYTYGEIGDRTGYDRDTVSEYIGKLKEQAEETGAIDTFLETLEGLYRIEYRLKKI